MTPGKNMTKVVASGVHRWRKLSDELVLYRQIKSASAVMYVEENENCALCSKVYWSLFIK